MFAAMLLGIAALALAQQEKKIPRIGILAFSSDIESRNVNPFREKLQKLGYVDGKNIRLDYRAAKGNRERLRELAKEVRVSHQSQSRKTDRTRNSSQR